MIKKDKFLNEVELFIEEILLFHLMVNEKASDEIDEEMSQKIYDLRTTFLGIYNPYRDSVGLDSMTINKLPCNERIKKILDHFLTK